MNEAFLLSVKTIKLLEGFQISTETTCVPKSFYISEKQEFWFIARCHDKFND